MITKAIIPAAGLGTRFLPATKAQAKEMLPIIDTPVIQFVVEEAVAAGIEDVLVVTGKGKRAIEDHFDRNIELEQHLDHRAEAALGREMRRIAGLADIHFIRQRELRGLGDAVLCGRPHAGGEAFAVLLGDTIFAAEVPATRQLLDAYARFGATVVAVEEVPPEKVSRYGIVSGRRIEEGILEVEDLVEKPEPGSSPSNLAIAGRYVLTPAVFPAIEKTPAGRDGEVQLTDALRVLAREEQILAVTIKGKRYDIGNKLDYLKTQVEFGLRRREFAEPLRKFLQEIVRGGHAQ